MLFQTLSHLPGSNELNDYSWFPMVHHVLIYVSGPRFNIKISSYQYRKSHCGDKTILRPSYLHNGISYTGKTTSLYWIRALVLAFYVATQSTWPELRLYLHVFDIVPCRAGGDQCHDLLSWLVAVVFILSKRVYIVLYVLHFVNDVLFHTCMIILSLT